MLSPSTAWTTAAMRAAGEARLLVEIKPTVLYSEISREDWADYSSASDVDTAHPSGELRLATEDVVAVRQSTADLLAYNFYRNKDFEAGSPGVATTYEQIGQFIQTVTVNYGFRVSKIRVGARATAWGEDKKYNGSLIVRLFANLREPGNYNDRGAWIPGYAFRKAPEGSGIKSAGAASKLYQGAYLAWDGKANYSQHTIDGATHSGNFLQFDLSDDYIYLPGGRLYALDMMVDQATGAEHVALYGSASGGYSGGELLEHDHAAGHSYDTGADMAFELVALGYATTGNVTYVLDMGEAPASNLTGELELKYVTPSDTSIDFQYRESASTTFSGDWTDCDDGTALNGYRYIQVKATLSADTYQLQTPRILGVRAAYKRSDKFTLASDVVEGYPASVYNAPEFALQGDPLNGEATTSDTSAITVLDPDGMLADNIIGNYNIKNDEVVFSVGWDGLATSSWLQIKTLSIENWSINRDGTVTLALFDQQRRFRNIEIPSAHDDAPETAEQINFDGTAPGAIKTEILQRAGVRPSKINSTSMTALTTKYNWSLVHTVDKQMAAQRILQPLNQHLLSFEYIDESGKWKSPFVNFSATPVATLTQDDINDQPPEAYNPGWNNMRNVVAVFFDGEGDNEADYNAVSLSPDSTSVKAFKELAADRLLSEWIPQNDDQGDTSSGIANEIVKNRLALQKDGLRTIEFSTRLDRMALQVGDHIYYTAAYYDRPGTSDTNPLTCFITSKNISSDLSSISWTALVLMDNEQSTPSLTAIEPPTGVTITVNGDRTVDITWTASADDNGTAIVRYDIFIRRKAMQNWGGVKTYKTADGSATYTVEGYSFSNIGIYDFGVRAVNKNGRVSAMATALAESITDTTLDAPDWTLLSVPGGWQFQINTQVDGALYYRIYRYGGPYQGFESVGTMPASRKFKAGLEPQVRANPTLGYGIEYGRFKLATVNEGGTGTLSTEQYGFSKPYQGTLLASSLDPTLPAESGTYPTLTQTQNKSGEYKYSVTLKITAPSGYEDFVQRYEIQRRDNHTGSYGDWELVGTRKIENYPAPETIIWVNQDVRLQPTVTYQWRCRAIALDGTESGWSDSLSEQVAAPAVALDKPTLSIVATPISLVGSISSPTRNSVALSTGESYYYKIETNVNGGGWTTWQAVYRNQVFIYNLTTANIADEIQFRVTAYDQHLNASTVSDATVAAQAETIYATVLAFTPVDSTNVVSTINASSEGIVISGAKIEISGSTTFSAGYDPTSKVAALGGQYDSAASGARVRIFPSSAIGLQINDAFGDSVFTAYVDTSGSYTAGDVVIGQTGTQYMMWDRTASTLKILGSLSTASSGARVDILPDANTGLVIYDNSSNEVFKALVGGTDVGDVIIGAAAGQHVKWDKSAGIFYINGQFASTGKIVTGSGNERLEIGNISSDEALICYSNNAVGVKIHGVSGNGIIDVYNAAHTCLTYIYGQTLYMLQNGSSEVYANGILLDTGGADTDPTIFVLDKSGTTLNEAILAYNYLNLAGTKILGTQQAHIDDADGTLADITTKFNTLLSYLDADAGHGLLAGA